MRTFQLSEAFFEKLRQAHFRFTIPILIIAVALGMFIGGRNATSPAPVVIAGIVLLTILSTTMYRTYQRQVKQWRSFRVTVNHEEISRTQEDFSDITISAARVQRIQEVPGKGLSIYCDGRLPAMTIPNTLSDYEECKALLGQWRPIVSRPNQPIVIRLRWPLTMAALAAMLLINVNGNPRLVLPAGAGLIGLFIYGFVFTRKSPDIDRRTKRRAWIFILPVVQLLLRMVAVWKASHP